MGSSERFDPRSVKGEQFGDEEGSVPVAIGLAGEGFDLVVAAFQDGA